MKVAHSCPARLPEGCPSRISSVKDLHEADEGQEEHFERTEDGGRDRDAPFGGAPQRRNGESRGGESAEDQGARTERGERVASAENEREREPNRRDESCDQSGLGGHEGGSLPGQRIGDGERGTQA